MASETQSGWCSKCGAGNDSRGYGHLDSCVVGAEKAMLAKWDRLLQTAMNMEAGDALAAYHGALSETRSYIDSLIKFRDMREADKAPDYPLIRERRINEELRERIAKLEQLLLAGDEREALLQLFINGPTWDGDVISKSARDELFMRHLARRENGWSYLTKLGVQVALATNMGREKERRQHPSNFAASEEAVS